MVVLLPVLRHEIARSATGGVLLVGARMPTPNVARDFCTLYSDQKMYPDSWITVLSLKGKGRPFYHP